MEEELPGGALSHPDAENVCVEGVFREVGSKILPLESECSGNRGILEGRVKAASTDITNWMEFKTAKQKAHLAAILRNPRVCL